MFAAESLRRFIYSHPGTQFGPQWSQILTSDWRLDAVSFEEVTKRASSAGTATRGVASEALREAIDAIVRTAKRHRRNQAVFDERSACRAATTIGHTGHLARGLAALSLTPSGVKAEYQTRNACRFAWRLRRTRRHCQTRSADPAEGLGGIKSAGSQSTNPTLTAEPRRRQDVVVKNLYSHNAALLAEWGQRRDT